MKIHIITGLFILGILSFIPATSAENIPWEGPCGHDGIIYQDVNSAACAFTCTIVGSTTVYMQTDVYYTWTCTNNFNGVLQKCLANPNNTVDYLVCSTICDTLDNPLLICYAPL